MSRPSRAHRLALLLVLAAAGCQDYNFNPVGHCVIQPGSARVTLSSISTADVLFVVDDSGSMGGEQTALAQNFKTFMDNLDAFNRARVKAGMEPFEFHVAITTTSVFMNAPSPAAPLCKVGCPGVSADQGAVCCERSGSNFIGAQKQVPRCTGPTDTSCGTGTCSNACAGFLGEYVCCNAGHPAPPTALVPCKVEGAACGDLQTHYAVDGSCQAGNIVDGQYYPHGGFISKGQNPRVLHFDKSLYPAGDPCLDAGTCVNGQGFTSQELRTFFEQNVAAGTCGSGQEQALLASKLAVSHALLPGTDALHQVDYYSPTSKTYTPGGLPADWPHQNAKLVVVYVGDEDDCSSPESASDGVVLYGTGPGQDACVLSSLGQTAKEDTIASYVEYFTGLKLADQTKRPVGAAFIVSATLASDSSVNACQDQTCVASICKDPTCTEAAAMCGGQAPGTRLLQTADSLRSAGADVVVGSICDNFGTLLGRVADIVKPPGGLTLPSEPASSDITVLRIAGTNGKTRKACYGPAPAGTSFTDAKAQGFDWWFTQDRQTQDPWSSTRFVYINHDTKNCEAGAGETYSADYLGRLPDGGCSGKTPKEADDACVTALGGRGYSADDARDGDWTCYAGLVQVSTGTETKSLCRLPDATHPGTCICGKRGGADAVPPLTDKTANCPNGTQP